MRSIVGTKRGTTLVEILVTMVVLLIGIMTVIRMFPTGFGVVRMAESRTIATKLAQGELERWKTMSANLPTGILAIDDTPVGNALNEQYPGWPFESFVEDAAGIFTDPQGGTYKRGNVLNIRQVIGETARIPVGSYFTTALGPQYGARYTLAFGPIDVSRDPDDDTLVGLAVKSGDLKRRGGRRDFYPPYLRLGEYAVDYGESDAKEFYVAFPTDSAAGDRLYYISYSYWATDAGGNLTLLSVINQEVHVDGENGDWVAVPVNSYVPPGYKFEEVEDGTDSCARGFAEVPPDGWSEDNPYQFALADNILGVIAFNPVGHGMFEYTAKGVQPIEARIDYRILDPRIIREDRVVPAPSLHSQGSGAAPDISVVKLALRFILDKGDPTDNPVEPTFEGLHKDTDTSKNLPESVFLIDLATGTRVDMGSVEIDFPAGVVKLPQEANLLMWDYAAGNWVSVGGSPVPLAGRQLRFLYRADGDWTIQCQKAYALYMQEWGSSAVDYCHFKVGVNADGVDHSNRLYFSVSEAEKTVAVDYTYTGSDGVRHKVCAESRKISSENHKLDEGITDPAVTPMHYADLKLPEGATLGRVQAVVGTSFKVRVIWRDSQSWRYVDLDSTLVRGSQ